MADDAKGLQRRLERAAKMIVVLRELQAKTYEVAEELQALLNGEAITGDHLRIVEGLFESEYERIYGTRYGWQHAKDRPHLKRLIKLVGPEEMGRRIMAYFHEHDAWREQKRHTFGIFVTQFNQLAQARAGEPFELSPELMARDCHHHPPCTSDAMHTRRKAEDLRRGQA